MSRIRRTTMRALRISVLIVLLMAGLLTPGCDKKPGETTATDPSTALPEAGMLLHAVREIRTVLPRVPGRVEPLEPAQPPADPGYELALTGTATLLRPADFPGMSRSLKVLLFLSPRDPMRGHLEIQQRENAERETWPLLAGSPKGDRRGVFTHVWRVSAGNRLVYLVVLGLIRPEPAKTRSLEGYLLFPDKMGRVSAGGAVYPIDFGYDWPHPAILETQARQLEARLSGFSGLREQHDALEKLIRETRQNLKDLENLSLPASQERQRRDDLAATEKQLGELESSRKNLRLKMTREVTAIFQERMALSGHWIAHRESNPYRWLTQREKQADFEILKKLTPLMKALPGPNELDATGGARMELEQVQQQLENALAREQEGLPGPGEENRKGSRRE